MYSVSVYVESACALTTGWGSWVVVKKPAPNFIIYLFCRLGGTLSCWMLRTTKVNWRSTNVMCPPLDQISPTSASWCYWTAPWTGQGCYRYTYTRREMFWSKLAHTWEFRGLSRGSVDSWVSLWPSNSQLLSKLLATHFSNQVTNCCLFCIVRRTLAIQCTSCLYVVKSHLP